MSVWAAILAGGAGTRFWPLSTPERPKQLLPLAGDRPLLVQAVERLDGLVPPERILILTGPFLVDQVARVVPQIPRAQIFAEPRAASTAPALTWAAHWISQRDPGAQMLSLHADWAVSDERAFRAAGRQALGVAAEYDVLVTVGVKPTRNETGYGYIIPAKPLGGARTVRRFLEKPSPTRASSSPAGPRSRRATSRASSPPSGPWRWTWPCWSGPNGSQSLPGRSAGTTSAPGTPCCAFASRTRTATWWSERRRWRTPCAAR